MTTVECSVDETRFQLIVTNEWEKFRAKTFLTKEPETVRWILREFRAGDIFFDIGANIGLYSLLAAASNPGGTVVAIEPMAANLARLCENVAVNEFANVKPYCTAVSATAGFGKMNLASFEPGSSMHSWADGTMTRRFGERVVMRVGVVTSTVDMLAAEAGTPNLIKIDVDGTEEEILAGAASVLREPALRSVLIESNWTGVAPGDGRLMPLLDCGFVVVDEGEGHQRGDVRWKNTILSRPR